MSDRNDRRRDARSASKFGSSSKDGAEAAESANSTFSGDHNIVTETVLHEGGKPMEIVCYTATFDAYHVVHEDGVHLWYNEAMLPDELLAEWHAFLAKRQRVDSIEATLKEKRLETVSDAPVYMLWNNSKPHAYALQMDGYVTIEQANTNDPRVFASYPERSKRNGHNVAFLAGGMQGVVIHSREKMSASSRDPPECVRTAITDALQMAFDALPEEEKPEYKARHGMAADEFGQHKVNLENASHKFKDNNAYERLYLMPRPEDSQRQSTKTGAMERKRAIRYTDEFEACFPFLGIALARRELVADGHAYLNWAERQAQQMAAKRAGRQPGQLSRPANGFFVAPEHAHSQLLVVYRAVFKSPQAKDAYNSR